MHGSFEIFDHTADMGIRVRAATMPGLLMPAAQGLYAAIGDLTAGHAYQPFHFAAVDSEPALLLRDYLGELLILIEQKQHLIALLEDGYFDRRQLVVSAMTAPVDERRSTFLREVKAVTYHELDIRTTDDGYEAVIIVDI